MMISIVLQCPAPSSLLALSDEASCHIASFSVEGPCCTELKGLWSTVRA